MTLVIPTTFSFSEEHINFSLLANHFGSSLTQFFFLSVIRSRILLCTICQQKMFVKHRPVYEPRLYFPSLANFQVAI